MFDRDLNAVKYATRKIKEWITMTAKQEWLEFLKTQHAIVENDTILHFGEVGASVPELNDQTIITPLIEVGVIGISGEDSNDFLQNQFSNDVRTVSESHSQLNAYCSPKGRVLSLFRLLKQQDRFYLLLPQERLQATLKRLKMFVLRSKVLLNDASEHWGTIGIGGANANALIQSIFSSVPEQADDCVTQEQMSAIKLSGPMNRYLLLAPYEQLITVWTQCQDKAQAVSPQNWQYLNIQSGIPEVYEATSDEFVPQMLNLHSLNGISFKKGCYPGQEVVARMHYLGKQKRRMYLAHTEGDCSPQPGDNLYSAQSESEQSVGKIVMAGSAPNGGYDVLAVMQIAAVENDETVLTQQKAALSFKELPYFVEVEGKK